MKFKLELGENEKHVLDFWFNQLLGLMVIRVNQQPVKRTVRLFSEPIREQHAFQIDGRERLRIRIEKERKLLIGQRYRVFVNDRLIRLYEGV